MSYEGGPSMPIEQTQQMGPYYSLQEPGRHPYHYYYPPSNSLLPYPDTTPYQQYQNQPQVYQYYKPQIMPAPQRSRPRTPSPSPEPPVFHSHWDEVIKTFLGKVGCSQALRGFESDLLLLNEEWEKGKVPGALADLMKDLSNLGHSKSSDANSGLSTERTLDERKLDYIHISNDSERRSQTSVNKSISAFLAQNRARNDASNRNEFLQAPKRTLLDPHDSTASISESSLISAPGGQINSEEENAPTCARTDAKPLDRDVQMRYDIAKNEEGPLRRTIRTSDHGPVAGVKGKEKTSDVATDERLSNIESHLAIRYVPSPPRTFHARLNFLEDYIVKLEKEYPPWAALHFCQPNRGWPPPPRTTPIIVPSHLTSTAPTASNTPIPSITHTERRGGSGSGLAKGSTAPAKNSAVHDNKRLKKSSLHRAVMERLEVKKAMSDLAGGSEG